MTSRLTNWISTSESIDTSSIHLDILANLKRANSLAAGIAYAVMGRHAVKDEPVIGDDETAVT